jgi:hypothetical protein
VWTYEQKSGNLIEPNGNVIKGGYSGFGKYRNKPEYEHLKGLGCLPKGLYIFGWAFNDEKLGPVCIPLIPCPKNIMYGRSGFFSHGVEADNPNTEENESLNSSHGCLCEPRLVREKINESFDRILQVIYNEK